MITTLTKNQQKIIETFTIQNERNCKTDNKQLLATTESGKKLRITFYNKPYYIGKKKSYLVVGDSGLSETKFTKLFKTNYPNVYFGDTLNANLVKDYNQWTYETTDGLKKLPIAIIIDRERNQIRLTTRDKSNKAALMGAQNG